MTKQEKLSELMKQPRMGPNSELHNENTVDGLIELCKVIPDTENKTMLEIGSFIGVSTEVFALNFKHVTAVDIWGMDATYYEANWCMQSSGMTWELVKQTCAARLAPYNSTLIQEYSTVASKNFPDNSFDFIYIDGFHAKVEEDIVHWLPKVKDGGFIGGHDYDQIESVLRKMCLLKKSSSIVNFDMSSIKTFSDTSWLTQV